MVPLPVNTIWPLILPSMTIASTCCGAINATAANAARTDHRNFDIFIVSSLHIFCVNCGILMQNSNYANGGKSTFGSKLTTELCAFRTLRDPLRGDPRFEQIVASFAPKDAASPTK